MANIFEFKGYKPVIHESAFVHPNATVTGDVIIGADVYIGPGAAIRGDWGRIVVEDGCNVQENCTIHMFPGETVTLHAGAHIGHGAIVHGASIGKNALIGMNAVIMDNRKIVIGNPARIVKDVTDAMVKWKSEGTELYRSLPEELHRTLKPTEPLRSIPEDGKNIGESLSDYKPWKEQPINQEK